MLITWMAYVMILGAIAAGGALALERLVEIWGGARRLVWVSALLVSLTVPLILAVRPAPRVAAVQSVETIAVPVTVVYDLHSRSPAAAVGARPRIAKATLDQSALALWALGSCALLILIARGFWLVRRNRARWAEEMIDGQRVLVSDDLGPAVVGAWTPRIVVPRWVLSLDDTERRMMLVHEAEHVAAGDPRTLLGAALALALCPWNPALWLIVHRLRLAIEIDCDARVLHAIGRPREYGLLLLSVGARSARALPLAASLAERRPFLERRIIAMTLRRPTRPVLASLPFVAVALLAVTAVAQTPAPAPLTLGVGASPTLSSSRAVASSPAARSQSTPITLMAARSPAAAPHGPDATPVRAAAEIATVSAPRQCCELSNDTIAAWMLLYHPNVLRGDSSVAQIQFVVDANGALVKTAAVSRSQFAAGVGAAAPAAFGPVIGVMRGRVGGGGSVADRNAADSNAARETREVVLAKAAYQGKAKVGDMTIAGDAVELVHVRDFAAGVVGPYPITVAIAFLKPLDVSGVPIPTASQQRPDEVSRDSLRAWIARFQPAIAAGDTTYNLVAFSLDEAGAVVATAVGHYPQLNERLATIRATRERFRAGDREGAAEVIIRGQGQGSSGGVRATSGSDIMTRLHVPGTSIRSVESGIHDAGEVAPGPLQVMIVHLRP